jgi:hypothetical protein
VTKLKSHGKTVIVIGPDKGSTAAHVIELADRFKYYTDIVKPTPSAGRRSRRSRTRKLTAQGAVVKILRDAGEPIESALLKSELTSMSQFTDFNQKALGFRTWTSFLKSIDGVAVKRRSDLGIEVTLDE